MFDLRYKVQNALNARVLFFALRENRETLNPVKISRYTVFVVSAYDHQIKIQCTAVRV